ncbi:MAG: cytochrome c [Chloroflexi bacterium]|nr:cytochrome c [Chloroflexota bacterium]
MNTSKQVNIMIGLLFLVVAVLGAYFLNETNRQAEALEEQTERIAGRGARLFSDNCRSCHGLEGRGSEEGAIAPPLNRTAFLILGERNEFDLPETPDLGTDDNPGAEEIRTFLADTIRCGRTGTFMPAWSEKFGGTLSDTQIDQIVTLITTGHWDLLEEFSAEHDAETGATVDEIVFSSADGLVLTGENCGQYNALQALRFRNRADPTVALPSDGTPPTDGTPPPDATPAGPSVQGVPVAVFFQASCTACHGANREGIAGLGLPLLPEVLTEPDDFYFDVIQNGRPGTVMPAWGQLGITDEEIRTLVEFIKNTPP